MILFVIILLCLYNIVCTIYEAISRLFYQKQETIALSKTPECKITRRIQKDQYIPIIAGITSSPEYSNVKSSDSPSKLTKILSNNQKNFSAKYFTAKDSNLSKHSPKYPETRQSLKQNSDRSLPLTGSPKIDKIAEKNLSIWTEQLINTINTTSTPPSTKTIDPIKSPLQKKIDDSVSRKLDENKNTEEISFLPRIVCDPEHSLILLGLHRNIENLVEKTRRWFVSKILGPLSRDIESVTLAFKGAGLEHLGPQNPATFPYQPRVQNENIHGKMQPSHVFIGTAPNPVLNERINRHQTLFELSQQYPNDPIVSARVWIEKNLILATTNTQRQTLIQRIYELASKNGPLHSFCWDAPTISNLSANMSSMSNPDGNFPFIDSTSNIGVSITEEDAIILMHLFCVFMDEKLPCEEFYETKPFSSKYFYSPESKPSPRAETIAIQNINRSPPHFRLIAGPNIYDVHPGSQSIFTVIAYFVEYVHRAHGGFLGIGNIASPSIDLVSILDGTDY